MTANENGVYGGNGNRAYGANGITQRNEGTETNRENMSFPFFLGSSVSLCDPVRSVPSVVAQETRG